MTSLNSNSATGAFDLSAEILLTNECLTDRQRTIQRIEDAFAPDYDQEEWVNNPALRRMKDLDDEMLAQAVSQLTVEGGSLKGKEIAVLGTGPGREVCMVAARGGNVTAVDISNVYLNMNAEKLGSLARWSR